MATCIALLRGINVGGKHSVPMDLLKKLFSDAGAKDVATYIQSGNVVFTAPDSVGTAATARSSGHKIAASVQKAIAAKLKFDVPIVVRTADQLNAIIKANPFPQKAKRDPGLLYVAFLLDVPPKERLATLDPKRSPPDELKVSKTNSELYISYATGSARSKITNAWLDSTLKTVSTLRNWNTVLALQKISE